MSLLLNTAGDSISATVEPTTFALFTICGMCQVVSDTGGGNRQVIAGGHNTVGVDAIVYFDWGNFGGSMVIGSYVPFPVDETAFGSKPSVGQWFHFYIRCSGVGAGTLQAAWAPVAGGPYVTAECDMYIEGSSQAFNFLSFGDYSFTDNNPNMKFAHLRAWNVYLDESDLALERYSSRASRLDGLIFDIPADGPTTALSILDNQGSAATLTLVSIDVSDNPPVGCVLEEWDEALSTTLGNIINTVTLTDTLTATDVLLWSAYRLREQLDAVLVVDESLQQARKTVLTTDTAELVDEFIRRYNWTVQTTDSLVTVDDYLASTSGIRIVTALLESFALLSDGVQLMAALVRSHGDTVTVLDQLTNYTLRSREMADAVTMVDEMLAQFSLTRVLTDNLDVLDSLVALLIVTVSYNGSLVVVGVDRPRIRLGIGAAPIVLGIDNSLILLGGDHT